MKINALNFVMFSGLKNSAFQQATFWMLDFGGKGNWNSIFTMLFREARGQASARVMQMKCIKKLAKVACIQNIWCSRRSSSSALLFLNAVDSGKLAYNCLFPKTLLFDFYQLSIVYRENELWSSTRCEVGFEPRCKVRNFREMHLLLQLPFGSINHID